MTSLRSIVALSPESIRGLKPAAIATKPPVFEWVGPRSIFIEDDYQRSITGSGVALIRRIYAGFDWSRFKPPVCVRLPEFGDVLVCIDGQHTATAAACHPDIDLIPVMVIDVAAMASRAASFVGHNRDRLALTPPAIFIAELAAGDPLAVAADNACRAAGATILGRSVNLRDRHPVGSTIAIGTIKALAKRRGTEALTRIMKVLVAAGRGPIKADEIAAVALILDGAELGIDARLTAVVKSKTTEQWAAIGAGTSAQTGDPLPYAVAAAWCRELGIQLAPSPSKSASSKSAATRFVESFARAPKPEPAPKPAAIPKASPRATSVPAAALQPKPKPSPAPPPRPRLVAPPSPPRRPAPLPVLARPVAQAPALAISRNGVCLDLRTRTVTHRGIEVRIGRDDGVRLVASLLKVMPAMIDPSRAIRATFQKEITDGPDRLRLLVSEVNSALARARLEVKFIAKIGVVLSDLGA